ncbi:MAG: hypothetical protein EXR64_05995 [Dehalococcoidia bacterium]|nr:hypothetical protein [Dehalococcoidia bacterium]
MRARLLHAFRGAWGRSPHISSDPPLLRSGRGAGGGGSARPPRRIRARLLHAFRGAWGRSPHISSDSPLLRSGRGAGGEGSALPAQGRPGTLARR